MILFFLWMYDEHGKFFVYRNIDKGFTKKCWTTFVEKLLRNKWICKNKNRKLQVYRILWKCSVVSKKLFAHIHTIQNDQLKKLYKFICSATISTNAFQTLFCEFVINVSISKDFPCSSYFHKKENIISSGKDCAGLC